MGKVRVIISIVVLLLQFMKGGAQDIHYSHISFSPIYTNPAFTGYFNGNLRAYLNYRNQYYSFLNTASFQTMSGSLDFNIPVGTYGQDFIGVGLHAYYDRGGSNRLSVTNVSLAGAYSKALAEKGKHALTVGFLATLNQRYVNLNGVIFGDQFDEELGIISPITGEILPDNLYRNLDFSLGLLYFGAFKPGHYFYAGFTAAHLAKPQLSFYSFSNERLPMRFGVQFGSNIHTSDRLELTPVLYYNYQNKISEAVLGGLLDYRIIKFIGSETDLLLGLYMRTLHSPVKTFTFESMIILLGIEYTDLRIAFSYDANFSSLRDVTKSNSAFEVSLQFTTDFLGSPSITRYCPKL